MKKFLFILFLSVAAFEAKAQNLMLVHQKVGNRISVPLESIDSVRFRSRPLPQRVMIFRSDKSVLSLKISNIDSITYSLPPAQLLPEVLSLSPLVLPA
jgi:hypothetical protein